MNCLEVLRLGFRFVILIVMPRYCHFLVVIMRVLFTYFKLFEYNMNFKSSMR